MTRKALLYTALTTLGTALGVTFLFWLDTNDFQIIGLSAYQFFPLLGLLAFVTMWTQYMLEAYMHASRTEHKIDKFFIYTSLFVLVCILLHPTILIAKLYADGAGLPPGSYSQYVDGSMVWLIGLGTFSLLVFLSFEFRSFFIKLGVWRYVVALNDIAILAIFYHGLRLGTTIQNSAFMYVWYVLGTLLFAALVYKYYYMYTNKKPLT